MSKNIAALMAMVMAAPSVAVAGPYIGIGIGGTHTESSLTELGLYPGPVLPVPAPPSPFPDPNFAGSDDFSSTDVSFDVAVGWMFGMFGAEIGYTDFGSAEQRYSLPDTCNSFGCQSREWTAQMDLSGLRAFLVGSYPVNDKLDAYVKLGAMNWEADYAGLERNQSFVPDPENPPDPIGPRYEPVSFDGDDTGLAAAIGINLKTDSPFSVRVEFNYYDVDTTDLVWNAQLMGVYTF